MLSLSIAAFLLLLSISKFYTIFHLCLSISLSGFDKDDFGYPLFSFDSFCVSGRLFCSLWRDGRTVIVCSFKLKSLDAIAHLLLNTGSMSFSRWSLVLKEVIKQQPNMVTSIVEFFRPVSILLSPPWYQLWDFSPSVTQFSTMLMSHSSRLLAKGNGNSHECQRIFLLPK